jgi:hypothetical protein
MSVFQAQTENTRYKQMSAGFYMTFDSLQHLANYYACAYIAWRFVQNKWCDFFVCKVGFTPLLKFRHILILYNSEQGTAYLKLTRLQEV